MRTEKVHFCLPERPSFRRLGNAAELREGLFALGRRGDHLRLDVVGQERRGAELVADMRQRLHSLPELPAGVRPTVALYQPNGLTAGAGTLVDDAFQYAGLDNLAVIRALPRYTQLSLELLLVDKPSVLVMNRYDPDAPSLAQELQHHPSLKKAFTASQTVIVPSQAWTCGTPHIVQAVEILRSAAVSHMAAR